jgi:hypothetical protein
VLHFRRVSPPSIFVVLFFYFVELVILGVPTGDTVIFYLKFKFKENNFKQICQTPIDRKKNKCH